MPSLKNIKKEIVALVPMKGHSERVPKKNIRDFAGRPLYHWIIMALLDSKYVKEVYINTDSEFIAKDALKNFKNLKIINRPEHLRGDYVSMNDIIAYDLSQIDSKYFLQTHATNPLLKTETIDKAIETFSSFKKYDSLFSVNRFQSRFYDSKGKAVNHNPNELLRTQDIPPLYEENSNLYIFSKGSFKQNNNKRIGKNPFIFEINKLEAIDVDTMEDFKLAEIIKKLHIAEDNI